MANIVFPERLENLLKDSDLKAPIRDYANRVGIILTDNQMPFFPNYTDHGIDHINQVLESAVDLVPESVWDKSTNYSKPRVLCDKDAVVIIGATLLHDIAMLLSRTGFCELVREGSRFKPVPWFKENQEGHRVDRPWHDLWLDFKQEARHFSDRALGDIIGLESVQQGKYRQLPEDTRQWDPNHHLVIGEFIRRHHARLAHEIAVYGFPGLEEGVGNEQFPALNSADQALRHLADLIGLTARSHGMSLRVCQAYLSQFYPRTLTPMGCAVLYPMALLRVADYLQIDCKRTPAILLKLRNPQSPVSVLEWKKHLALLSIDSDKDPQGKMVTVSPNISQKIYLKLRELLAGLQKEMDHAIAVLGENYGARVDLGLDQLNLKMRRVYSNLDDPKFRESLPYIPERTGFSADPNLLTLLIEPLYGKEPGVGVRELMQNSVDAVCELHVWCESHGKTLESLDLPKQDSDVQIDFIQKDDGTWFLQVMDKGIGMTSETIQNYFLRAGASFRQSSDWVKEFLDEEGRSRVLRAGRFGVGAFSVFLLGPIFRLRTRHAGAPKSQGYAIEASFDSDLIEIRREEGLPVGTTIEVDILPIFTNKLGLDRREYDGLAGLNNQTDWFCWDWPIVSRRVIRGAATQVLDQKYVANLHKTAIPPEWSIIYPADFDKVYWTFAEYPTLICNGIKIEKFHPVVPSKEVFNWPNSIQLQPPKIAVFDSNANLSLTIQRYALSDKNLTFVNELSRDVTLSFIAHALVCGPTSQTEALEQGKSSHPLVINKIEFYDNLLRWCSSSNAVIPVDPWLYSLLRTDACIIIGGVNFNRGPICNLQELFTLFQSEQQAILLRNSESSYWHTSEDEFIAELRELIKYFSDLAENGLSFLGQNEIDVQILVSLHPEPDLMEAIIKIFQTYNGYKISPQSAKRPYFIIKSSKITTESLPINPLIEAIERYKKNYGGVVYVAEIKNQPSTAQPESLLAKVWSECLGSQAIPFDDESRRALINHGRQHSELKRHIEAWEEMKRTNSKWVVGGAKD